FKVVNFGSMMLERLRSGGRRLGRDEIRRQGLTVQRRIQLEAAEEISRMRGDHTLVVDTHIFIRTPAGAFPGLPSDVLKILEPSLLVLVEADPGEIACRRSGDTRRLRDQQSLEALSSDLEWSRRAAAACAVTAGAPVVTVRNEQDRQFEAAREILSMMKEVA
ncbi:MAG: AAA family ATPase, partial [Candidatus Bathyarchaeia archaeon]